MMRRHKVGTVSRAEPIESRWPRPDEGERERGRGWESAVENEQKKARTRVKNERMNLVRTAISNCCLHKSCVGPTHETAGSYRARYEVRGTRDEGTKNESTSSALVINCKAAHDSETHIIELGRGPRKGTLRTLSPRDAYYQYSSTVGGCSELRTHLAPSFLFVPFAPSRASYLPDLVLVLRTSCLPSAHATTLRLQQVRSMRVVTGGAWWRAPSKLLALGPVSAVRLRRAVLASMAQGEEHQFNIPARVGHQVRA